MKKIWSIFALLLSLSAIQTAYANGEESVLRRLIGAPSAEKTSTPDLAVEKTAPETAGDSADIIRITPDTTKILRLEQDAASVIVTNPDHISVVLDSPRLLIIMPRQPGATSFTVLSDKGETITTKTVVVTGTGTAKSPYVRIRRACGTQDSGCVPYAYFYCPDGCYEVTPVAAAQGTAETPPIVSSGNAESSGAPVEESGREFRTAPPVEKGDGPVIIQETTPTPAPTPTPVPTPREDHESSKQPSTEENTGVE